MKLHELQLADYLLKRVARTRKLSAKMIVRHEGQLFSADFLRISDDKIQEKLREHSYPESFIITTEEFWIPESTAIWNAFTKELRNYGIHSPSDFENNWEILLTALINFSSQAEFVRRENSIQETYCFDVTLISSSNIKWDFMLLPEDSNYQVISLAISQNEIHK
jgi:hypothetical protein